MRLEEVLPALREGRYIRRSDAKEERGFCVLAIHFGVLCIQQRSGRMTPVDMVTDDITAEDWEVIPTPVTVQVQVRV